MPALTRDTRLRELRPTVLFKLKRFFDLDDKWQELAEVIKTRNGEEKYTVEDIRNFEFELKKGKSPTEALIRDWGYDNTSVQSLIKAVAKCERYDVLEWLLVKEMKELSTEEFEKILDKGFEEYFNSKPVHEEELVKSPVRAVENTTPLESARCDHFDTYVSGADAGDAGEVYEENNPSAETEPKTAVIDGRLNEQKSSQIIYTYDYLSELTNNWNDLPFREGGHVLGEGGYATVFLGKPPGQRLMAVKRLKDNEAHNQFFQEVSALARFAHPNIVPLFGVSQDGPHWCIVYEYMENGSLDDRLFCKDETPALTGTQRCRIAKGIAQGLTHLHTNEQTPYVHRDIKPENILLDYDFTAKLGDCGLARRGPVDPSKSHTTTMAIIGTEFYCAPEYFYGEVSVKLDAFGFGMVLYQMLTGQSVYDDLRQEKRLNSHIDSIFTQYSNDAISCLVDKKMVGCKKDNLQLVFEMARRLTEVNKHQRPKVQDVLPEIMDWPQDW